MSDVESMDTEDLIAETLDRIRQRQGEAHKDAKRWQFRAESAEHSVDRWQTRAESAEARVEELTEERDKAQKSRDTYSQAMQAQETIIRQLRAEVERLEQEVAEVTEDYKAAADSAGVAHGQRDELRTELARKEKEVRTWWHEWGKAAREATDLRAENERLTRERDHEHERANVEAGAKWSAISWRDAWKSRVKELEAAIDEAEEDRTAVPRVIRPDEWKAGQVVAARPGSRKHRPDAQDRWIITTVSEWPSSARCFIKKDSLYIPSTDAEDVTVVLLEDAPEDADEGRAACGCDCGCGETP